MYKEELRIDNIILVRARRLQWLESFERMVNWITWRESVFLRKRLRNWKVNAQMQVVYF